MRSWALPIVSAVALSLAVPSGAEARPRFGPGAVLGAFAGAMFGGFRHAGRHHHRRAAMHATASPRSAARSQRRTAGRPQSVARAPQPPTKPPQVPPDTSAERAPEPMPAAFWPDAAADLADYVLLPSGNSRFWTHGYDSIVEAAFAASDAADQRGARARRAAPRLSDAGAPNTSVASADPCGPSASADAFIEKIDRAVEPTASQRDALEELRGALARAIERITTSCPAAMPVNLAQRLNAIVNRIWAMHDALLTIRLPFERFYNALSEEQRQRLRGEAPSPADVAANATERRGGGVVDRGAEMCLEPSAGMADWMMRTIERAAPREQQRAGGETMRTRSAAMAKLVAASCPSDPRPDAMNRVAAATDRLDVMLFAAMNVSPMLQHVYDSLDEKQKAGLARALHQAKRSGAVGGRS